MQMEKNTLVKDAEWFELFLTF